MTRVSGHLLRHSRTAFTIGFPVMRQWRCITEPSQNLNVVTVLLLLYGECDSTHSSHLSRHRIKRTVNTCGFCLCTEIWFCCWTLIWLSRHWAWLRRGYWRYRSLIDWLIDWNVSLLNVALQQRPIQRQHVHDAPGASNQTRVTSTWRTTVYGVIHVARTC